MALAREKIEHVCERARRVWGHTARDLKPVFIIYRTDDYAQEIEKLSPQLKRLRGGKQLEQQLKAQEHAPPLPFAGLIAYTPSGLWLLQKKEHFLLPIFLNADDLHDPAEVQHKIYHVFWHGLDLVEAFKASQKEKETADYTHENFWLTPRYTKFKETKNNLIADIFAAFMTELEQKSGFIQKLALMRAQSVIEKHPGFLIEKYPYPLVSEACQMVFDDLKSAFQDTNQLFPVALKMAREVAYAYGDDVIQQWRDFCIPAQEMVWLDYKKETVLGNAVFTAEDAYVRTSAYFVCELLGHTAAPASERNLYNPYATGDKNRSLHFRACEEAFQRVLSRAAGMSDPSAFLDEVKRQNKQLSLGHPMGWCAPAIITASNTFEKCLQTELTIETVSEQFQKSLQEINWDDILKVSRTIIGMHREGLVFGLNEIAASLAHLEGVEPILRTLRTSVKSDFFDANVANVQRHKTLKSSIHIGFGPTAPAPEPQKKEEAA